MYFLQKSSLIIKFETGRLKIKCKNITWDVSIVQKYLT